MDAKQLAQELRTEVKWSNLFSLINDLGPQLNERQLRFMKARLIEKAIANLSKNIKWVNTIGQDHQLRNIRIETKFATNSLTTGKGNWKKSKRTGEIKLTNTIGCSDDRILPKTFDFLMIIDKNCAAVIAYEDIRPVSNGDGLKSNFSYDELEFVVKEENILSKGKDANVIKKIDSMLEEIIEIYNV